MFLCQEPSIKQRIWKNLGETSASLAIPPGSAYVLRLHLVSDVINHYEELIQN